MIALTTLSNLRVRRVCFRCLSCGRNVLSVDEGSVLQWDSEFVSDSRRVGGKVVNAQRWSGRPSRVC